MRNKNGCGSVVGFGLLVLALASGPVVAQAEGERAKVKTGPVRPVSTQRDSQADSQSGSGGRAPAAAERNESGRDWGLHFPPRATFDLGLSSGSYSRGTSDSSYTEFNAGLNLFFADWLDWRNAVFYRLVSRADDYYGLDTSLRAIFDVGSRAVGMTVFAGPGWRFPSSGDSPPFAEAGLILKLGGVALGGGLRTFLHSWVSSGAANENQYFIILSGGGSL